MKQKITLFLITLICSVMIAVAQTNPTAQTIPYAQNFASLTGAAPAYPAGWQGWTISGSLGTSYSTAAPFSDQAIAVVTNTSTSSHVGDFIGKIGIMSTGSALKAICLSINTTGYNSVQVIFDAQTQRTENTRLNELGLQYRIGTTGTFTNLTGSGYLNQLTPTNVAGTGAVNTINKTVNLPGACDNQSVVQLRWVVRDSSGGGNRPGFSIDNININGTVILAPSITVTPTSLSGFTYVEGSGPSAANSFTVSGSNLTASLIINAASNYAVDTVIGGPYYNSISLPHTLGTVSPRIIYTRLKSGLTMAGSPYNQFDSIISTGAVSKAVAVNGSVTPLCVAPSSQATSFNFTTITYNNIAASFTPTTANGYLVIQSLSSTLTDSLVNGTTYVVGASIAGGTIVSLGAGTSFNSTGLASSTRYYYFVFSYNNVSCGGGPAYRNISPLTRDTTTNVAPCINEGFTGTTIPATPTGWAFNLITGSYTTAGNFGVASPSVKFDATGCQVTAVSIAPQMASSISFWMKGQGTMTGSSLLVEGYIGGTWTTIQNITSIPTTATTKLYNASSTPALPLGVSQFRITYTKVNGNVAFDDLTMYCVAMPTCSEPTSQPTSISFPSFTHNSMTINWTGGNGDSSLVVVRESSPVSVSPLDGVSYNPTTVFGTIGAGRVVASGQYVVYANNGNSVTITNLIPSTTYHVAVFEYNRVISNCYLDTLTAINSQTTLAPPIVISPSTISAFSYDFGAISSTAQMVNVSATGLSPSTGSIDIRPLSAAYEVATAIGGPYATSISLPYSGSSLSATPIYIRLILGLNIGAYNTQLQCTNSVDTTRLTLNGTVNVSPCSNLFFSEYIEGTSNEKYFEVYNASDNVINLANYKLMVYANGSVTPTSIDSSITGLLSPHTVRVFKNAGAVLYTGFATSTIATFYNGDDALVLFDRTLNAPIDIIGRIGEDPGIEWAAAGRTTLDKTLIRKFSVTRGVSINPTSGFPTIATEWDTLSVNTISNLGIYRNVCCVPVSATISQTVCIGDLYVFNGETLTVTGTYLDTLVNHVGCDSFLTLNFLVNSPGVGGCPTPPRHDNMCYPVNVTAGVTSTIPYSAVGYANINTHTDTVYQNNGSSSYQVGEPIGSCGTSGTNNKTLWYKFTAPFCATPSVYVSTDDRSTTNFNTRISVYRRVVPTSCSGGYTEIACNDNANYYLNTGATNNSTVVLTPNSATPTTNQYAPGEDLYIQTSGVGTASGNFGLIIDAEPFVPSVSSVGSGSAVVDWTTTMISPWGGISGAYIQWRPVGAGPTVGGTYAYIAGPSSTYTITGLLPGTNYEYWASYVCGNGGRWWSKKGTFTTSSSCVGTSPSIVSVIATTPCNTPTISFNATSLAYSSYRVIRRQIGSSVVLMSPAYYTSPSTQTYTSPALLLGRTYQFYVVAYCGTAKVDSSAISSYTVCASLRTANPNATEQVDEDKDVAYIMPNGTVVYGLPFNAMDLPFDATNPNEQTITLETMDANTYFGRDITPTVATATEGALSIYPNPANTEATLSYTLEKASDVMLIQILDAQGKVMMTDKVSNPAISGNYTINLNQYSAGVYFVKVQAGDYMQTRKLMVDK
ncbi:MAG: fibronectin type III domain-containing protein [Bacteroidota bacterium]